jgi:NADP-dependent 3-hydroxy acid dehydrogenase YdfG
MIAAITGASAGVGRATAREFAAHGWDVALIARNAARLETAVAEIRGMGVRALSVIADVARYEEVAAAVSRIERELGPIDLWVNNAMATVFATVNDIDADEIRRATEVTYLGQAHGMKAALGVMRARDRGTIVNVGSALAYRAVPLQSVYCGAKFAVRGFTDALRCELLHDRSKVNLVIVHLPAVNTPQFDWALNKTGKRARPVPPIYQPEAPARAIYFAATHPHRREVWVGLSTFAAIVGNKLLPGLLDRWLAKTGYESQLSSEDLPPDAPANLERTVDGDYGAHGRFDSEARTISATLFLDRHGGVALALLAGLVGFALVHQFTGMRPRSRAKDERSRQARPQRTPLGGEARGR